MILHEEHGEFTHDNGGMEYAMASGKVAHFMEVKKRELQTQHKRPIFAAVTNWGVTDTHVQWTIKFADTR